MLSKNKAGSRGVVSHSTRGLFSRLKCWNLEVATNSDMILTALKVYGSTSQMKYESTRQSM